MRWILYTNANIMSKVGLIISVIVFKLQIQGKYLKYIVF